MKKFFYTFFRKGFTACGFGPLVLAVFYLIIQRVSDIHTLTVDQVCMGIFSLAALAFIAGGMNAVYQIERLPLMAAILLHGSVLYASYLITYLLNGWLKWDSTPVLVFSGIFIFGYLAIWAIVYCIIRRNTNKINAVLKKKQQIESEQ